VPTGGKEEKEEEAGAYFSPTSGGVAQSSLPPAMIWKVAGGGSWSSVGAGAWEAARATAALSVCVTAALRSPRKPRGLLEEGDEEVAGFD
jgi:hypothetical protein